MPINIRDVGGVTVLSNFGRLLNDPRYVDAGRDVRVLLDEGRRKFVLDLATLREVGDAALGLLTTLTREIRRAGGEAVLANVSKGVGRFLEEMRMDDYWDVFASVEEARDAFGGGPPRPV
jgi:anti-anti-sigma factor